MAHGFNEKQFSQLVFASMEGMIGEQDKALLNQLLCEDEQAVELYLKLIRTYGLLNQRGTQDSSMLSESDGSMPTTTELMRQILEKNEQAAYILEHEEAERQEKIIQSQAEEKLEAYLMKQAKSSGKAIRYTDSKEQIKVKPRSYRMMVFAAAACLMFGLTLTFILQQASGPEVAILVGSTDAQWKGASLALSDKINVDEYELLSGLIEIKFDQGANVIFEGPAKFKIESANGAYLEQGRLVASVPPRAQGFTVNTPSAKMVDLGTEFGVYIDDIQTSHLVVFKGSVTIQPHASNEIHTVTSGEMKLVGLNSTIVEKDLGSHLYVRDLSKEPESVHRSVCFYDKKSQFHLLYKTNKFPASQLLSYEGRVDLVADVPKKDDQKNQYSMVFDDVKDCVVIAPRYDVDQDELSYGMWVKFTDLSSQTIFFMPSDLDELGGDELLTYFNVYISKDKNKQFNLHCDYQLEKSLHVDLKRRLSGPINLSKDQWVHLAVTIKNKDLQMYFDGQLIVESHNKDKGNSGVMGGLGEEIIIGNTINSFSTVEKKQTGFMLNDFAIYACHLTEQDVAELAKKKISDVQKD